jgi:hypothetical protein
MYAMLPESKEYKRGSGRTRDFNCINIKIENVDLSAEEAQELL